MSAPQSPGGPSAPSDAKTGVAGFTGSFARLFARGSPLLQSTRLLLLTTFVLTAMFAGYYAFFAHHRQNYLTERNLRTLAGMGSQIEASLESAAKVLEHHIEAPSDSIRRAAPFIPVLSHVALLARGGSVWRGRLSAQCGASPPASRAIASVWSTDPTWGPACLHRLPSGKEGRAATVDMALNAGTYLESILSQPVQGQVFQKTVLADTSGQILAQAGAPELGLARLDAIWAGAKSTEPGAEGVARAWGRLKQSPSIVDVELAGSTYRVFLQPCCISREGAPSEGRLVLAGLVRKWDFVRQSHRVSLSAFTIIAALLVLAVLSRPFLKLWLMGERQRVLLVDGILLGVSTLVVPTLVTIFLLDFYTYQKGRVERDGELVALSDSILAHFHHEVQLARRQLEIFTRAVARHDALADDTAPLNPSFLKTPYFGELADFPLFESWALVDSSGMQWRKWAVDPYVQPVISVRDRDYFQGVVHGPKREIAAAGADNWLLESIRSWTTGKRQAVLAIPSEHPRAAVATIALEMASLIGVVLPPSFGFAMVDENGMVLFHSDTSRNLEENFFMEADRSRELRSSVFARTAGILDITYGGSDHRAAVVPVPRLPWTLITFQEKQPARVSNLELLGSTAFLALIYLLSLVSVGILALMVRPSYRAPWLWPDRRRGPVYAELCRVLGLFLVAFLLLLATLERDGLLLIAVALPALVILVSFTRLTMRDNDVRLVRGYLAGLLRRGAQGRPPKPAKASFAAFGKVAAVNLGVLLVLSGLVVAGDLAPLPVVGLALFGIGSVRALTFGGSGPDESGAPGLRRGSGARPIAFSYGLAAALLLALVTVAPAAAFSKLALSGQAELLVKYGQLRLARAVEERGARRPSGETCTLLGPSDAKDPRPPSWCGLPFYPGNLIWRTPQSETSAGTPAPTIALSSLLVPYRPETSVGWRGLTASVARDSSWSWTREGDVLSLRKGGHGAITQPILSSTLPTLRPRNWNDLVAFLCIGGLLSLLLTYLVRFLMRRVFLVGVTDPLSVTKPRHITPLADLNLIVLCRNCDEEQVIPTPQGSTEIDLRAGPIEFPAILDSVRGKLRADVPVFVRIYEEQEQDPAAGKAKRELLESLVRDYGCSVTVIAGQAPGGSGVGLRASAGFMQLPEEPSPTRLSSAWQSFVPVGWGRWEGAVDAGSDARAGQGAVAAKSRVGRLIESESRRDRNLKEIWGGIERHVEDATRQGGQPTVAELLDLLGDRAEHYYDSLWKTCQPGERVVLVHLAEDGFVNEKDRKTLRRLLVRGLIIRRPHFTVMNETFRRYLARHARAAEAAAPSSARSLWDSIRLPGSILVLSVLFVFAVTQQELFTVATAMVAGVPAAFAGLSKIAGMVANRRSGASA